MKTSILLLTALGVGVANATTLVMPPVTPQGHSCGGVYKTVTVVGFDANDNVQATLAAKTTCGTGGRGASRITYTQTYQVTWDNAGAYTLSWPAALVVPGAVDSYGNYLAVSGNGSTVAAVTLNVVAPTPYVPVAAFVPQEIGRLLTAAEADVAALGLLYGASTSSASSCYPAGYVCNQSPVAGTVAQFGSDVNFWYAAGPGNGN
jgi:hypothetical protein